jgi:hypothetical protein
MPNYSKTKVYLIAGVFFLLWLGLHFFPGKMSMFTFTDWNEFPAGEIPAKKYLQSVIDYHQEFPAFGRRWFSNFWFSLFPNQFSGYVFILSEWLAMVALGFLWLKRNGQYFLPIFLFFISFPVLFAWFPSQYTFEEPFLWLFLFGFVTQLSCRPWLSMAFAILALLTRETALLFIVPWLWLEKKWSMRWIIPICVGFLPYLFLSKGLSNEISARWELLWHYNFQNQTFAVETILLFLLTFFPTLFFWKNFPKQERILLLLLLLVNTFLIFFAAKARESRLHLLPLFFILLRWPNLPWVRLNLKISFFGILGGISGGIFLYSGWWQPTGAMIETVWIREYGILWGGLFGLKLGMLIFGKSTDQK